MVLPFSVYCDYDKVLAQYWRDVSVVHKKIAILMESLSAVQTMAAQGVCNEPEKNPHDTIEYR